jgi:hypothetical protein
MGLKADIEYRSYADVPSGARVSEPGTLVTETT